MHVKPTEQSVVIPWSLADLKSSDQDRVQGTDVIEKRIDSRSNIKSEYFLQQIKMKAFIHILLSNHGTLCSFRNYSWNPTSLCRSFAADPVVSWVLISRVPDAQVIPERPSDAHSRLHRPRGSLSTCAVLSLTYQGHQGGAAKTFPETTSHGWLPQLRNTVTNPNTG